MDKKDEQIIENTKHEDGLPRTLFWNFAQCYCQYLEAWDWNECGLRQQHFQHPISSAFQD